jgi:hypothetical protein
MATYLQGTADAERLPAVLRPGDYAKTIRDLWAQEFPLTALTKALKRRRAVKDTKFSAFEQSLPPMRAYVNNASNYDSDDTSIAVDDGAGNGLAGLFRKGMIVRYGTNPASGELLRVTANPTDADNITVSRGFAGTTAATLTNNGYLTIQSSASADGEESPDGRYNEPSEMYNYIQILQTPWSLTRVRRGMATRHGTSEEQFLREQALRDHALLTESMLLFGVRGKTTVSGRELTSSGGVTTMLDSGNAHDGSSTGFTYAHWNTWTRPLGAYGSAREKVAFCGSDAYGAIQDMVIAKSSMVIQAVDASDLVTWGIKVERLRGAGPDILLMRHPLLDNLWAGEIIILDLTQLELAIFDGVDTVEVPVSQDNNVLETKREFLSILGLGFGNALAHARIYGVSVYTA